MVARRDVHDCVAHPELRARWCSADEAVAQIAPTAHVVVSGFTKSGEPKTVLGALARRLAALGQPAGLTLSSGASLSDAVEGPLAPFVARRAPYMSNPQTRQRIDAGTTEFADIHLSQFARNLMYGFYDPIDWAIVEVSAVRADGAVVLTSSVGVSAEALARAERVILEVATHGPDFTGFHDIVLPTRPPDTAWPLPITEVNDRAGTPWVRVDPRKVVAVVEGGAPAAGVPFKPAGPEHAAIADHVRAYLLDRQRALGWGDWFPPLQSGVGNVANAVVAGLLAAPLRKLRIWTEVFQDGLLPLLDDDERFGGATATGLSFSDAGWRQFEAAFARARDRITLRPMWISNHPELITRLFVVAMNTPLEVDMFGAANSTQIDGRRRMNGLGGSGDFLRSAYLSLVHTPSVRRLSDGRTVSCVVPVVEHVDHPAYDIKCVVTEHGFVPNTAVRSARHRAEQVIDTCAHPHFRPLLRDYLRHVADEPLPGRLDRREAWQREYDAACRDFPTAERADPAASRTSGRDADPPP